MGELASLAVPIAQSRWSPKLRSRGHSLLPKCIPQQPWMAVNKCCLKGDSRGPLPERQRDLGRETGLCIVMQGPIHPLPAKTPPTQHRFYPLPSTVVGQ